MFNLKRLFVGISRIVSAFQGRRISNGATAKSAEENDIALNPDFIGWWTDHAKKGSKYYELYQGVGYFFDAISWWTHQAEFRSKYYKGYAAFFGKNRDARSMTHYVANYVRAHRELPRGTHVVPCKVYGKCDGDPGEFTVHFPKHFHSNRSQWEIFRSQKHMRQALKECLTNHVD